MIFYNGATGSLGQCFSSALAAHGAGVRSHRLQSRLEDRAGFARELAEQTLGAERAVCLVQMAAKVSVPACESDPSGAHKTNVLDCLATVSDFVGWAIQQGAVPSVIYVSSGHVYASSTHGMRLRETDPVEPRSVYARSKLAAERALAEHAAVAGYPLLIARVFGLLAPKQPANYMLPGLIRRIQNRELAGIPGLSFYRDFLDARDVCRCLVELCKLGLAADSGILNVCSGEPIQLRQIVEQLLDLMVPGEAQSLLASLVEAPGRSDDVPFIAGDPTRLEAKLGGRARIIPLEQTLRDALGLHV
jgi:nucleoside-diphosphate-sugar epimerase